MKISEDFTMQVTEKLGAGEPRTNFTQDEIDEINSWTTDEPIPQQIVFNYGIDTAWQDLAKHLAEAKRDVQN